MITTEQNYILSLLRETFRMNTGSLSGKSPINTQEVERIILQNGILLTVYQMLPSEMKEDLRQKYLAAIKLSVLQSYEGERMLDALGQSGMSCVALKGWEFRKMYPDEVMRQMADVDILVNPYNYLKIKKVAGLLGYSAEKESSWKHDNFWKESVHMELHKRLTDDSKEIMLWEKDLWSRVTVDHGNVYRMSNEDFYIFHFVHLHKDFLNGSLGLRRIVDTWLLTHQKLNVDVITSRLESFGIMNFHDRMVNLSKAVMGEIPMNSDTEFLLLHAFKYGIYGSRNSYKAGRIASMGKSLKSGKIKSAVAAVFLPYGRMKAQFPVLQKWPVFLPFCWAIRIFRFLRSDLKTNRKMLDYSKVSEADYTHMKRLFEAGGINSK